MCLLVWEIVCIHVSGGVFDLLGVSVGMFFVWKYVGVFSENMSVGVCLCMWFWESFGVRLW